jgi:hypothetical protein
MKPRELFEVFVRVIGLWEFVSGVEILPHWIATFSRPVTYGQFPIAEVVMMLGTSGLKMIGGLALFFGARFLAKYTFPETTPDDPRP